VQGIQGPAGPQGPIGPAGTGVSGYEVIVQQGGTLDPHSYVNIIAECSPGKWVLGGGIGYYTSTLILHASHPLLTRTGWNILIENTNDFSGDGPSAYAICAFAS
jgi:hypothetical protein